MRDCAEVAKSKNGYELFRVQFETGWVQKRTTPFDARITTFGVNFGILGWCIKKG
jgi:hypothetical protein